MYMYVYLQSIYIYIHIDILESVYIYIHRYTYYRVDVYVPEGHLDSPIQWLSRRNPHFRHSQIDELPHEWQ